MQGGVAVAGAVIAFLVEIAFRNKDRPTVEARSSIVHSATSHLVKLVI